MSSSGLKTASDGLPQILVSQQLGTSETTLYTCPANTSAKIMNASLCNTTSSPVTVSLSLVKSGGTVGDGTHRIVSGFSLPANDTLALNDLLGGHVLGPGDKIAAVAGTATAVDAVISAVVFS